MGLRLRRPSRSIATVVSEILGTCAFAAPLVLSSPIALTQEPASAVLSADIPAQPLAQALAAFAQQTGLQLVYVSGIVSNQKSHAVAAGLTAREGLPCLLQGRGFRFGNSTPQSIRIRTALQLPKTRKRMATDDEPSV